MNINIYKHLCTSAYLALVSSLALAQESLTISGKVVDVNGEPIPGSIISVDGQAVRATANDKGEYSISVPQGVAVKVSMIGFADQTFQASPDAEGNIVLQARNLAPTETFLLQKANIGTQRVFDRTQSTASFDVIENKDVDRRSEKNIANSILGQGNGLISLDGSGSYYAKNPSLFIRGLQSLDNNAPLCVVDGFERNIDIVSPAEVECVTILKDAAAVALYGYKGSNGVVLITTKRGKANTEQTISINYDRTWRFYVDKPEFVDGPTWARAMNEALTNEGSKPRYSDQELAAFDAGGDNAYYFPNVDWVSETFRNSSYTNHYGIDFTGGSKKFRYYTLLGLTSDKGFVANHDANDGYDTQSMYSRGNLRANLDISVTDYTKLQVNVAGTISEMQQPGANVNLWSLIYSTPSAAFPVRSDRGDWGGNSTWAGTLNPVAQATGAGYYKIHERALYADVSIDQSLSIFTDGLGAMGHIAYDNFSTLYEDHSKTYKYGQTAVSFDENGNIVKGDYFTGGEQSELGSGANTNTWERRASIMGGIYYDRTFGKSSLFAQAKYQYDYEDLTGTNTTVNRQTISLFGHYAFAQKYLVDVALVGAQSNRLAPDHKWSFSPTVSAAWVASNEDFLRGSDVVNFLKVRASYGKVANDWLPGGEWTYYTQLYSTNGVTYPITIKYDGGDLGGTVLNRMATTDPKNEAAYKFNVGVEATLFNSLNVELDYFNQTHKNIWVEGSGAYTSVIGFSAPYTNDGEVNNYGFEAKLDFNRKFGDVDVRLGGNILFTQNEIMNMGEEPKAFDNLVETGGPLKQTRGLIALGLFKDQAEIDASPAQNFTTTRPGDIKYLDLNEDGVIDANDKTAIGYSVTAPEIYYSFHVGAEWKGIGLFALFQGTGRYSAVLNAAGYYWGLYNNSNLSQEVYDGRWTQANPDPNALYPRLSSATNANNYQTSTFWLRDRSYLKLRNLELYYNFPQSLMDKTFLSSAKIYVRGNDLFTHDDLDNKDAAQYGAVEPTTRSVIAGVKFSF